MGHLGGDIILSLGLILHHQGHQDIGLVSSLAPGAGQHRFGLFVHSQLVHLTGELNLQVGIQSQSKQSLG